MRPPRTEVCVALHGGRLAARALKQAGVECVFTLSGGHIMALYDGCLDEGIRIVDVRHEQAAVHAADAWSRCRPGEIGVAAVTAGPGVTDGITGIANAFRAGSPLLVIGGQAPLSELGRGSLQELDHLALVRPITKFAAAVRDTQRIAEHIEQAIRYAVAGTPGPSYLEIPMDVFMGAVTQEDLAIAPIRTEPPRVQPDRASVCEALDILSHCERPVLVAGSGVKWSRASAALTRFVSEIHLPTYTNGMGRGCLAAGSPELLDRSRRRALEETDCAILAGAPLDFRLRFGRTIRAEAPIVQLDLEATSIGHNRTAEVGLVGNLGCSFELLLEEIKNRGVQLDFSGWRDQLRETELEAAGKMAAALASDEVPIDPLRMCREVRDWLETLEDPIVIGDGGDIVGTASKVLPARGEGSWMDPGPLGTLGVGMPFALAAQLAHPGRRVVIVYGDGSFGLNGFEYDTAVRFKLPIVGVVGNDGAWGQMMRPQGAVYGSDRLAATLLDFTRYDRVVEALGGHGEHVERPEEIRPALERAAAAGVPALVNVVIRRDTEYRGGSYV